MTEQRSATWEEYHQRAKLWIPPAWCKANWIWSNGGTLWTLSDKPPISNCQNDPQDDSHSINITVETAAICGLPFTPPAYDGWLESVHRCQKPGLTGLPPFRLDPPAP